MKWSGHEANDKLHCILCSSASVGCTRISPQRLHAVSRARKLRLPSFQEKEGGPAVIETERFSQLRWYTDCRGPDLRVTGSS